MPDRLSVLALALASRDGQAGWSDGQPIAFRTLEQRIRAWAGVAQAQPGSSVALFAEDALEFSAALLGAWQAGKTVWLAPDILGATCAELRSKVGAFLGDFPSSCNPLAPGSGSAFPYTQPFAVLAPDFEALVVLTSGSTGAAQAVPKKLSQLDSEIEILEHTFGEACADAQVVATVSHQHIYGLLFKVLWPLCAGRRVQAHSVAYPEQLAAMLGERSSILVSSPAHLGRLPQHVDWPRDSIRAVFSSGGPLPEEAVPVCERMLGHAPVEVYGSSESGGIAWRQRRAGAPAHWNAFASVEWRTGEDGELKIRSPHLRDDAWFAMADRVRDAGAGAFELLGRADRIVKVEGKRVSLDALEAGLRASSLVIDARIVPDDAENARLAAFVIPSASGHSLLAREGKLALNRRLRALLGELAETVALPRRWRYLDAFPVNPQGKTPRAVLLALLDRRGDAPAAAPVIEAGWTELARSEQSVTLELQVPAGLLYFDGHFPQAPILPGVVQLDWAIAHGRRLFALPPVFREVSALKFQNVIAPGATLQLQLDHDAARGQLTFRYSSPAGQHSSGRVLFSAPT
ncbi:MAG TPA: AMP-binding protein [Telluria sp.]